MREIKFRAWDTDIHKMVYEHSSGISDYSNWGILRYFDEIMQYTGLKDKNGKEIYEGDIIECDKLEWYKKAFLSEAEIKEKPPYREVVEWDFESLSMREDDYEYSWTVIGNIYENPELLEDK